MNELNAVIWIYEVYIFMFYITVFLMAKLSSIIYVAIKNLHLIIAEINFNSTGDCRHIYEVLLLQLTYLK